jgi:hypothetical protein
MFRMIFVTPGLAGTALDNWKKCRKLFRGDMQAGKGPRRKDAAEGLSQL